MVMTTKMRSLYSVFLCCLLIQECLPSQQTRTSPMFAMADITNDLGVCALQILAESRPGRNIAFSPYGLASVSMLLYEGASGTSALQLSQALQLPYDAVYARVGFRDLYRHLRTYFMSDGFLKGLMLSRENICIRANYMKVLTFYGFDLPDHTSVEPCDSHSTATTTTSTTQRSTSTSTTIATTSGSTTSGFTTEGSTSASYTAKVPDTTTVGSGMENKETPASITQTESLMETTPPMTTAGLPDITTSTNQGTEPSGQLTTMTTEPSIKTTQPMVEPTTVPSIETSMNLVNVETTTNAEELLVTTVSEGTTNPPTMPPNEQTSSVEAVTSGDMGTTLSNKIGTSGTTSVNSEGTTTPANVDVTTVTNVNIVETTVANVNSADITTGGSVETTPATNIDTTPAVNGEAITTTVTTNVPVETPQNTGTTGTIPETTVMDMINNNVDTVSDLAQVTTESPMTTVSNAEQVTNIVETQTTTANKNDKLSTIVEVTAIPPSTVMPQDMEDGLTEGPNESNTTPSNPNDVSTLVDTENPATTVSPTESETPANAIVFNTTPVNKNDKLSTIVEVTVPPPSTISPDTNESPADKPETTTENIDTTAPTTISPETTTEQSTTIVEETTKPPSSVTESQNLDTTTIPNAAETPTPLNTESPMGEPNNSPQPPVETLEPASSMNTLVQLNDKLIDNNNNNNNKNTNNNDIINNNIDKTKPSDPIVSNMVEDSLADLIPHKEQHGAYIDKAKPNKASLVLNYDYLNPENFQDYVNIVEKNANVNDTEPDFMDGLIQEDTRRNKSRMHHFIKNNQVRYTYESYLNDYRQKLDVRNARSIAPYETPLLHKIKSWIKYKSGFAHLDPLPVSPITPSFAPLPYVPAYPTFAAKSAEYHPAGGFGPGENYQGGYQTTGGGYSSAGSYQSSSGGYRPSGGSYSTSSAGSYSSSAGSYQSSGGYPSYSPAVTPSYEPPQSAYGTKLPDHLDWFLTHGVPRVVPVMRYSAVLPYAFVAPLDAFALEIPLDDEKYKLLILLPSSTYGLNSLLKALPYCSIRAIYAQLRYVPVYATLPVFDIAEQISLTSTLQQLGVNDIFYLPKADLSTMSSDSNLFVRDIMQVVAIYAKKYNSDLIHEVPPGSTQTSFTASHSFVYFVVDNFTKVSLLAGIVEDPTRKH
ncbi:hypothetical protein M8J77_006693 [Diaphorina citri]|nr:hypothetical protein M8J77_006693 [Diaphorina citri]